MRMFDGYVLTSLRKRCSTGTGQELPHDWALAINQTEDADFYTDRAAF